MKAEEWDQRYGAAELVWGAPPNRWVEQEVGGLPAGRALDLACGEGRNALWLAARGWQVTGVDFSQVGLDKARELEARTEPAARVQWRRADVTNYRHGEPVQLALICYLQLPAQQRRQTVRNAAAALAPGGVLLVIGHDSTNIAEGTGGPQDPQVLFTADDVQADLTGTGLEIDRAEAVLRPVEGAPRPAVDALLRAHRPLP